MQLAKVPPLGSCWFMKTNTQRSGQAPTPQTVTPVMKLKTGAKTILITTTDKKISAHAGQAIFAAFLRQHRVREVLAGLLPQRPTSPNALAPVEIALGFMAAVLAGADKLTRVGWLRGDPVLPQVLNLKRLPSQSTLSRFFAGFRTMGHTLTCFQPLWRWAMERLPHRREGYTLDLDSTALLHEDGHQEGVRVGYTRVGLKPCLHPLLAVLAEARLCAQFWLRPGDAHCAHNVIAFTETLLLNLPANVSLRLVRADAGFQNDAWLSLLEQKELRYIVVADLSVRVKSVIRSQKFWQPTAVAGLEVADGIYHSRSASRPRRLVILRRRIDSGRGGGKLLLDCPGYQYQALLTNLGDDVGALDVWRDYNGRAQIENVIKELKNGFGLPRFCCQKFFATEAVLSLAVLTYNLYQLFCQQVRLLGHATIATARYRLFHCAGWLSRRQNQTTLQLAIPPPARTWWQKLWTPLLTPKSNCDAVETSA
jgi:DNA-directed RNA polymerase subunit N (RpoN/RPB10)